MAVAVGITGHGAEVVLTRGADVTGGVGVGVLKMHGVGWNQLLKC